MEDEKVENLLRIDNEGGVYAFINTHGADVFLQRMAACLRGMVSLGKESCDVQGEATALVEHLRARGWVRAVEMVTVLAGALYGVLKTVEERKRDEFHDAPALS